MSLSASKTEYNNIKYQRAFKYYLAETMMNGFMIDLDPAAVAIIRNLYSIDDFAQEVGGFFALVTIIVSMLFSFLQTWPLEKYLIETLYKFRAPKKTNHSELAKTHNLLTNLTEEINQRVSFKLSNKLKISDAIQRFFNKFNCLFACCRYKIRDYNYFKAATKLASELDIKRILRTLRLMRVFLKYRTTRNERKLMRM